MIGTWITRLAVFFTALILASCSFFESLQGPDKEFGESRLYIDKEFINLSELARDDEKRSKFINKLINTSDILEKLREKGIEVDREDVVRRIAFIPDVFKHKRKRRQRQYGHYQARSSFRGKNDEIDRLILRRIRGAGGFQVRLLLRYLQCDADELRSLRILKPVGKVKKWVYDQKAEPYVAKSDAEYEYGSGYIFWHVKAPDCQGRLHDYKFHIAVDEAYQLLENQAEREYELDFGNKKINAMIPKKERKLLIEKKRQFNFKLHAEGQKVHVLSVFLNNKLVAQDDPIYESDEKSCIDVFFEDMPPGDQLPNQFGYCLGRCDEPPILNTGGV